MRSTRFELAPGVTIELDVPDDARRERPSTPELGTAIATRVVALEGWETSTSSMRLACVSADASRWVPGAEDLVLDRATQIARSVAPNVEGLTSSPIEHHGEVFVQHLEGTAKDGRVLRGAHVLGFPRDDSTGLLCTAICSATTSRACDGFAPKLEGALGPPPPPNLLARAVLFAATSPHAAGAIALTMVVAVASIVLARRPRPRR